MKENSTFSHMLDVTLKKIRIKHPKSHTMRTRAHEKFKNSLEKFLEMSIIL